MRAAAARACVRHARPLAHLNAAAFTICAHICFSRLAYTLIAGAARVAGCAARDLRLQRSAMGMQGQISEIMLELVGLIAGRRAERMRRSRALMSVVSGSALDERSRRGRSHHGLQRLLQPSYIAWRLFPRPVRPGAVPGLSPARLHVSGGVGVERRVAAPCGCGTRAGAVRTCDVPKLSHICKLRSDVELN